MKVASVTAEHGLTTEGRASTEPGPGKVVA